MRKTNSRYLNIVIPEAVADRIQAAVDAGEFPSLGAAIRDALAVWLKSRGESVPEQDATLYPGARIDIPNRTRRSAKYVKKGRRTKSSSGPESQGEGSNTPL